MKQQNKSHIISRYVLVIIGIMLLVCGIIYKLVDTTVVHRVDWNKKADKILTKVDIVPPERGNIYASNGTLLAGNLHYYTARLDWGVKCVERPDSINKYMGALCDSLASMFPEKDAKYWEKSFRAQMERPKRKRSYRIASKLTFSEYQRLKKFPFFNIRKNRNFLYSEMDTIRIKPYGKMASRSIGGVAEIKGDTVNVERNGFVHGISGLEMALDSLLYGKPGKAQKIQLTNKMASYATIPAERGYDIKTTIDVEIQDIVEEELYNMCVESKAEWGTAILMEVKSGEIWDRVDKKPVDDAGDETAAVDKTGEKAVPVDKEALAPERRNTILPTVEESPAVENNATTEPVTLESLSQKYGDQAKAMQAKIHTYTSALPIATSIPVLNT